MSRPYKSLYSLPCSLQQNTRFYIHIFKQEMSYDTYAPLTLTFDLVTPKSIWRLCDEWYLRYNQLWTQDFNSDAKLGLVFSKLYWPSFYYYHLTLINCNWIFENMSKKHDSFKNNSFIKFFQYVCLQVKSMFIYKWKQ